MLKIFEEKGRANSRNKTYQCWQQDNYPEECYSPAFTVQKRTCIHQNLVEAAIVVKTEGYIYVSANAYYFENKGASLQLVFI